MGVYIEHTKTAAAGAAAQPDARGSATARCSVAALRVSNVAKAGILAKSML
jgi:hypothetical protein